MSIYASTLGFDGEDHVLPGCAAHRETSPGCWDFTGEPCNCSARQTFAIRYRGSHVYPDPEDRGAELDLGVIPGHIAEGGGDDEAHAHWDVACHRPFLRVGFVDPFGDEYPEKNAPPSHGTVVLDAKQVEELRDNLTDWLEHLTGGPNCPVGPAQDEQNRRAAAYIAALAETHSEHSPSTSNLSEGD